MTDNVNNSNYVNNAYQYQNPDLEVYDKDSDGQISVFELQEIDDTDLQAQVLAELEDNNDSSEDITDEKIQNLELKLEEAKNNQGVIGSLWNGIKNFTGLGSSTNKCEQAIENYKNGKISYDEAESIITGFSSKQESSVNLAANIATGIAAVLVVGSAVATGGVSLGVIAAAAGIGGATKAGLKFIDRATNKVEGDALDAKQIAKDSLSGAVDGAVSVATMVIGTTAVTGKTVAEQTLKETIKQGAVSGAKAGAISGAVTGASDYTIEAALEEDVEFSASELAKTTLMNAAGGAVAGGVMGGVSSGIQYGKVKASNNINGTEAETINVSDDPKTSAIDAPDKPHEIPDNQSEPPLITVKESQSEIATEVKEQLEQQSQELSAFYKSHLNEAQSQIDGEFGALDSVEAISNRAKSEDSILDKLISKFQKNKLTTTTTDACSDAIGDAYGSRIQLKSLSSEESKSIIEDCLYGYDISYEQFVKYLNGDTSGIDDAGIATINEIKGTIIDLLKEQQTQEVVDQLVDAIGNGRFTITELNNYGDDLSSYFTNKQLQEIADAYYVQTGERLKIVTCEDLSNASGAKFDLSESFDYTVNGTTDGAIKDSGYASSQMNTKIPMSDGTIGNGELQIRGVDLNTFADAEHIPYDIRQGKIKSDDANYADIYNTIKSMTKDTYNKYNQYLTDTYRYLRLRELGININQPQISDVFSNGEIPQEALKLIDMQGLIEVSQRAH